VHRTSSAALQLLGCAHRARTHGRLVYRGRARSRTRTHPHARTPDKKKRAAKPGLPPSFEADTWARLSTAVQAIHGKRPVNCSLEDLYRVRWWWWHDFSSRSMPMGDRQRAPLPPLPARSRLCPRHQHTHTHTPQDVEAMVLHGMADRLYDNLEVRSCYFFFLAATCFAGACSFRLPCSHHQSIIHLFHAAHAPGRVRRPHRGPAGRPGRARPCRCRHSPARLRGCVDRPLRRHAHAAPGVHLP